MNKLQPLGYLRCGCLSFAAVLLILSGCSFKQHLRTRSCHKQVPPAYSQSHSQAQQTNQLPLVALQLPHLITIPTLDESIELMPLAPQVNDAAEIPEQYRNLTIDQCQKLSAQEAPNARALESHRDWLATLKRTPAPILRALTKQAQYERSQHVLNSTELYLNLVRVYSTVPVLDQTGDLLNRGEEVIEQFRAAGVEVPTDLGEFQRKLLEVCEQRADLRFNQNRLNDGLHSILNLSESEVKLIWTDYQFLDISLIELPTETEAIRRAFLQRGDLKALEILAENAHCLSLEALQGAPLANKLLGGGLSLPGPAKWWQCLLSKEIECLKQQAQSERQRQLLALVESKKKEIEFEIKEILHGIAKHQEVLIFKELRLSNLRNSLEAMTLAKDVRAIDPQQHLQLQAAEIQLLSEYTDTLISIETDWNRLKHGMGELY